jgi:protein tyrosine phosphatase (PTP) superfamily phosphohydrolase (DUF442 family)/cytochrome c556
VRRNAEGDPVRRWWGGLIFVIAGCGDRPTPPAARDVVVEPVQAPGLHNAFRVSDRVYSGSSPEGDAGFAALKDLGIKTIISVDGATPEVAAAHRHGLAYVHLPVGYDGISRDKVLALARAATDLPGPIYVHCHHGQHRGPAAAALMRRCHGGWTADEAIGFLKTAGTDPKYEGLYASVRDEPPLGPGQAVFPEVADVPGLTARMVEIDDLWDALKKSRANGWQSPNAHGSTAHLALQLSEQFREAARLPDADARPESFRRLRGEAEHAAAELEAALRASDATAAGKAFDRTAATCANCHREHRDHKRP